MICDHGREALGIELLRRSAAALAIKDDTLPCVLNDTIFYDALLGTLQRKKSPTGIPSVSDGRL